MGILDFLSIKKEDITKLEKRRDIKGLTQALREKDESVGMAAAEALNRLGEEAVNKAINQLVKFPRPSIDYVKDTVRGMTYLGEPAVKTLLKLLSDPNGNIQGVAALGLGKIGEPSVPSLIEALSDPNNYVRMYAAIAFLSDTITNTRIIDPLLKAMDDDDLWVCLHSAASLLRIDPTNRSAIQFLKDASHNYSPDSSDAYRDSADIYLDNNR